MTNEFKKIDQGNITRYVLENASGGGTSSGSVASVSMPIGGMQRRKGDNLIAQESDKKKVPASTPRNFVAKNAKSSGAGAHKDKKKEVKQGNVKHKKPYMEELQARLDQLKSKVAEGSEDKIAQLKKDHDTAVHWSKNEKSPQKREAARRKAETIKAHLEKQYKQGVAEGSLNELSKDTLKSYSKERGATIHADQRDASGARTMAADKKKHGDTRAAADWDDEASWLDKRAEKGAKGVAQATTKIAKKGMKEGDAGLSKDAETNFHAKLDQLVHATFGKRKSEQGMEEDDSALNAFLSKGGKVQQLPYKKPRKADKTDYGSKHIGGGGDKMKASRTGTAAKTQGSKVVGVSEDTYFESLQQMVERQLEPNMELDTWVDNFQNADPNKYHQFKNKTLEKKK